MRYRNPLPVFALGASIVWFVVGCYGTALTAARDDSSIDNAFGVSIILGLMAIVGSAIWLSVDRSAQR